LAHNVTDFHTEVLEASREAPVLVDFWAEWCAPCRVLGPVLEGMAAAAHGRWRLAKVDTERHPELADRYGIRGIPDVRLFVDGEPVDGFVGALPEPAIKRWLDGALAVLEARSFLFTDPARAAALVEGVEPGGPGGEALLGLQSMARLLLRAQAPPPEGEGAVVERYMEALQALSRKDFQAALEGFVHVVRSHRTLDGEGAREGCVAIFRHLGPEHPLTLRYRKELAAALYM